MFLKLEKNFEENYQSRYGYKINIPRAIIANKVDVDDRVISREEGEAYAAKIGVPYLETSAKTGQNVQEIMKLALELKSHPPKKHGHCTLQ